MVIAKDHIDVFAFDDVSCFYFAYFAFLFVFLLYKIGVFLGHRVYVRTSDLDSYVHENRA